MNKVPQETTAILKVLGNEASKFAENSSARGRLEKAARLVARGEYRRARTLCEQVATHGDNTAARESAYALTAVVLIQADWPDHKATSMRSVANDLLNNCCDDAAIEVAVRGWAWRAIATAALATALAA